jgi:tRNA modification GTPase
VLRNLFRFSTPVRELPAEPEPGQFWPGRLGEGGEAGLADQVVLAVKMPGPVVWLEVHCHGGPEVIRFLLEILAKHGIQACSWQELERLTCPNPGQALALAALVEARTIRTAAILLDQYQGAFRKAVEAIQAALRENQLAEGEARLRDLVRYRGLGRHLTTPWRMVIAGAPNVGKSSLVNALAGYQRSVVAAIPGTTRDVVTTLIAIDGWPVELADTAGLRPGGAALEQMGIDRARAAAAEADLCLWVLDGSAAPVWPAESSHSPQLVVNKVDLAPAWDLAQAGTAVQVSAKTGTGLEELSRRLAQRLVPDPPDPGAAVPFTATLCDQVEEAFHHNSHNRVADALQTLEATVGGREPAGLAISKPRG